MVAYDCPTLKGVAAGHAYVLGTHFCFPPVYAMHADTGVGALQWTWTHDIADACCFVSKGEAERMLRDDPGIAQLLARLDDDAAERRVRPLKVELKIAPA